MENNLIKKLVNEIKLFRKAPKEYIWVYTYPKDQKVEIGEYNPRVKKQGQDLIDEIKKKLPELKIHFLGSVALEIPGQKDIDIFIECLPKNFHNVIPELNKIIGQPVKKRERFVEWVFEKNDIPVELFLIDPTWQKFLNKLSNFETLKKNRQAYTEFKIKNIGKSMREYERKKYEFFYTGLNFK